MHDPRDEAGRLRWLKRRGVDPRAVCAGVQRFQYTRIKRVPWTYEAAKPAWLKLPPCRMGAAGILMPSWPRFEGGDDE